MPNYSGNPFIGLVNDGECLSLEMFKLCLNITLGFFLETLGENGTLGAWKSGQLFTSPFLGNLSTCLGCEKHINCLEKNWQFFAWRYVAEIDFHVWLARIGPLHVPSIWGHVLLLSATGTGRSRVCPLQVPTWMDRWWVEHGSKPNSSLLLLRLPFIIFYCM
jgi:hypothetical protein